MTKGAATKIRLLEWLGITISFAISLRPSASGCNSPQKPTTLGPRRRWIAAIILRSAIV
jgi:hypothetical protein